VKPPLAGRCDARFQRVRDAFRENFERHGEIGAACCVYVEGRPVVDLWGGHADASLRRPWQPDTLVNHYSLGKPFAALALLQLVDAGALGLDDPVARTWPDFARKESESTTLRHVLCHRAGLPAVRDRLPAEAVFDWDRMCDALARTRPWWEPGTRHAYHTNTYGFLVGELVRRATGTSFSERLRTHVAGPVDADVHCGLASRDLARCADVVWQSEVRAPDWSFFARQPEERRMVLLGYMNPPTFSGVGVVNSREWRTAQVPSTNGHATARGVARVYAALAAGGAREGARLLSSDLLAEAARCQSEGWCPVLEREVSFGLGFQIPRPDRPLGPHLGTFCHYGTGGSLGFADPEARVGFGYVMNRVIPRWRSPCNRALVAALYDSL
jgi:CubicO group peptidase (beta-lactamase class C family)